MTKSMTLFMRDRSAGGSSQTRIQTETVGNAADSSRETPVLHLIGAREQNRTQVVRWASDVVDNEHLNRKKTKICCIYHPSTEFGESEEESLSESSDGNSSSESDSDSDSFHHHDCGRPNAYERQPKFKRKSNHPSNGCSSKNSDSIPIARA